MSRARAWPSAGDRTPSRPASLLRRSNGGATTSAMEMIDLAEKLAKIPDGKCARA
jgi:hypothetical protein